MSNKMSRFKEVVMWLMLLSVIGFSTSAQAAIVVNIELGETEDALNITKHGTCGSKNPPCGCMLFSGKQQINFNLIGDKSCSLSSDADWELHSVVLSEYKNDAPGISQVAASDFGADINTGFMAS